MSTRGRLGPDALETLPCSPGVYLFHGDEDDLLYIGKSVNLRARVQSYFRVDGGHNRRTARLKHEVRRIAIQQTGSELEALLLESRLIKAQQPRYNVRGRRYEHYPFLKITEERYPQVLVTRSLTEDGGRYFGPFQSAQMLHAVQEALGPLFQVRSCTELQARPCLQHDIGRCMAPCAGQVDAAYREAIDHLEAVLAGKGEWPLSSLRGQMLSASDAHEFERAARLRDRLHALMRLIEQQASLRHTVDALDVLVVLPGFPAPAVTFLAVRRARWVAQLTLTPADFETREAMQRLKGLLVKAFVIDPVPSAHIRQEELDEVQIVGAWLYRRRALPGVFTVDVSRPSEVARAAIAHARTLFA